MGIKVLIECSGVLTSMIHTEILNFGNLRFRDVLGWLGWRL